MARRAIRRDGTVTEFEKARESIRDAMKLKPEAAEEYKISQGFGGGQSAQMGLDQIAAEMKGKKGPGK